MISVNTKLGLIKENFFDVEIPTSYMFNLEFVNETIIQGFISFDVQKIMEEIMELYGTHGSIIVPDPNMFGGPVSVSKELGSVWVKHSVEEKPLGKLILKIIVAESMKLQSNLIIEELAYLK